MLSYIPAKITSCKWFITSNPQPIIEQHSVTFLISLGTPIQCEEVNGRYRHSYQLQQQAAGFLWVENYTIFVYPEEVQVSLKSSLEQDTSQGCHKCNSLSSSKDKSLEPDSSPWCYSWLLGQHYAKAGLDFQANSSWGTQFTSLMTSEMGSSSDKRGEKRSQVLRLYSCISRCSALQLVSSTSPGLCALPFHMEMVY